jgi:MFS family permease
MGGQGETKALANAAASADCRQLDSPVQAAAPGQHQHSKDKLLHSAIAIATTFAQQSATALTWMTLPVLAPYVALSAGVEPSRIGEMAGVMFLGALLANLLGAQLVAIIGAVRTLQLGAGIAATGLMIAQHGTWAAVIGSAVVIGLGYGLGVPSASHILARNTAAGQRGLVFSIKQSGVPVGGLLAGMMLPAIAVAADWRWAVATAAALCLGVGLAAELARSRLDEGPASRTRTWRSIRIRFPLLTALRSHADLSWLAYSGFASAAMQGSVFALLVAFLVSTGRFDVVSAGLVFATMHLSGATARIVLGIVSDRLLPPQRLLAFLSVLGGCAILTLAASAGHIAQPAVFALAALIGATVSGWNGVYLAEIAHLSPPDRVGETTASAVALVFLGYIVGPLLASFVVGATGSYTLAFGLLATLVFLGPVLFVRRSLRRRQAGAAGQTIEP